MPSCWGLPDWRDTTRWFKCREKAAKQMIAEGWNKHARKFHVVQIRRAVQLYKNGCAA